MPTSSAASRAGRNCRIERGPAGGVSTKASANATRTAATLPARARRDTRLLPLLGAELFQVRLLRSFDEALVAAGIHERVGGGAGACALRLPLQIEHRSVL